MQVVDGVEHAAEDFTGAEKVMQVAAGEVRAGVAMATWVERAGIRFIAGVLDLDVAKAGK